MDYYKSVKIWKQVFLVLKLIEIEVPDRLAGIRRFLSLLQGFLELLFQQIGGVLLGLHRLPEYRFAAAVLLFHSLGSFFDIRKHLWLNRRGMRNDGLVDSVDFEDCAAARASYFEGWRGFGHNGIIPQITAHEVLA